jgi:RHS repeat-associated protein
MFWDESNRLRVVYDQNSYQMQHYIYDAAGERTLKASSKIENVYENGQVEANTTTMGLYTTYVSPYMVVDANQKYSKHYFNGTQRVASKIGEQDITIFENGNQYLKQANSKATENTPATDFDTLKSKQITDFSYYLSKSTNNATAKNLKVNYTEYKKVDTNTETKSAKAADNNSAYAAQQYAEIYYYHSDHLGTGTFLSDFDGNPYQFFLNLPFGETMAEQHSYSGEYTNRYKFNGKELDEETGFYYYGARYYNPKFSIWLSVDPLAEKYPNFNPYAYCYQNPVNFIDPTGMEGDDWYENKLTGEIKWFDDKRSDCSDTKGNDWQNISSSKDLNIIRGGKQITGHVGENGKGNLFFWDIERLSSGNKKADQNIATLDPRIRKTMTNLIIACRNEGLDVRGSHLGGYRTYAEQDDLYAQGRTKLFDKDGRKLRKVTNATAGHSNHNFGLSMDVAIYENGVYLPKGTEWQYTRYGQIAKEQFGLEWGGDWANPFDPAHVQFKHGKTMQQLRDAPKDSNGYLIKL